MPRAKKEVSEEEPVIEAKSEFTVYNERLEVVRVYSVEVHGENAGELAKEFVNKQKEQGNVLVIK